MAERLEEEGFLGRWSRLKRETRTEEPAEQLAEDHAASPMPEPMELPPEALPAERVEEVPELPSLESLGSDSDYTGFLRRDVPAELRREALRKAWASDPVIAGFRGFAEYDWDYNAPGYGALRATDDIARLLDAVLPDEKREDDEVVEEVVVVEVSPETVEPATMPPPDPSLAMRERKSNAVAAELPLPPKAGEG